jgi:hypothetical protein
MKQILKPLINRTMKTIEVKLYAFDELSEEAKETAIEKNYDINTDYEWWDSVYEDFSNLCGALGIDVNLKKTYFNGFYNQGSGSSFNAEFRLMDLLQAIEAKKHIEYAPKDAPDLFHPDIDRRVLKLLGMDDIHVYCRIKDTNRESSVTVDVDIDDSRVIYDGNVDKELSKIEDYCQEIADELNHWLFKTLEKEYEYLTTNESIAETLRINEYEFTEDGEMY